MWTLKTNSSNSLFINFLWKSVCIFSNVLRLTPRLLSIIGGISALQGHSGEGELIIWVWTEDLCVNGPKIVLPTPWYSQLFIGESSATVQIQPAYAGWFLMSLVTQPLRSTMENLTLCQTLRTLDYFAAVLGFVCPFRACQLKR